MGRIRDPSNNQARINARVPYNLFFAVAANSEKNDISMSEVIRRALSDYLKIVPSTNVGCGSE